MTELPPGHRIDWWRMIEDLRRTGLAIDAVGVKATTNEGSDDIGRGLAIAAHAVALIQKL